MKSSNKIYKGETWHCRHTPTKHSFTYPYNFLSLDLNELTNLDTKGLLFGYNRHALVSLWDRDYLKGDGPLAKRVLSLLEESGISPLPSTIRLLTVPRILGYAFNPVSFYLCYDSASRIQIIISEVNNTFGESHLYICEKPTQHSRWLRFQFAKNFYVSPFFSDQGEYHIFFRECANAIEIQVHILSDNKAVFSSSLRGLGTVADSSHLALSMLRFPLTVWLTISRIHLQALILYFKRKVKLVQKPQLKSKSFVRRPLSVRSRIHSALVSKLSSKTIADETGLVKEGRK